MNKLEILIFFENSIADSLFLRNTKNVHLWSKSDKNTTTTDSVRDSRASTIEKTKPLIATITHDKTTNWR